MQQVDMPLLLHGEVTDQSVDMFDREKAFIERHLIPLKQRFPNLRVVLEHVTTSDAVQYVLSANKVKARDKNEGGISRQVETPLSDLDH